MTLASCNHRTSRRDGPRSPHADEPLAAEFDESTWALDSTTIHLGLSMFPWDICRKTNAAVMMHTLREVRGPSTASFTSRTGKSMTSTCSNCWFPSRVQPTSWIAPASTSGTGTSWTKPVPSSEPVPGRTAVPDVCIPHPPTAHSASRTQVLRLGRYRSVDPRQDRTITHTYFRLRTLGLGVHEVVAHHVADEEMSVLDAAHMVIGHVQAQVDARAQSSTGETA